MLRSILTLIFAHRLDGGSAESSVGNCLAWQLYVGLCLETAATSHSSSLFGGPPSIREYVESSPLSSAFLWEASEQR